MRLSGLTFIFIGLLIGGLSFEARASESKGALKPAHVFYIEVVQFKKGSNEISKDDQTHLMRLLATLKEKSQKVEQVHVAVWADEALPAHKSLAAKDRELVESRIMVVEDFLEGPMGLSYIESYNMAERTNWFARALVTRPRDIKGLFDQKGAPKNVPTEDFQAVKAKGQPSMAVLLFELEPQAPTQAN